MQPVPIWPPVATRDAFSSEHTHLQLRSRDQPLSISNGYSSFSEGSQAGIDLAQLNTMPVNATHPWINTPPQTSHIQMRDKSDGKEMSQYRSQLWIQYPAHTRLIARRGRPHRLPLSPSQVWNQPLILVGATFYPLGLSTLQMHFLTLPPSALLLTGLKSVLRRCVCTAF